MNLTGDISSAGICGSEQYYQHDPDDEVDNNSSEKLLLVDGGSSSGESKLRQRKGKIINCAKETFDNGNFLYKDIWR